MSSRGSPRRCAAPVTAKAVRDYSRVFFASASDEVPDKQGRITVPAALRTYACLDRDCVVIGANTRLEIWDAQAWETYLAAQEDSSPKPPRRCCQEFSDRSPGTPADHRLSGGSGSRTRATSLAPLPRCQAVTAGDSQGDGADSAASRAAGAGTAVARRRAAAGAAGGGVRRQPPGPTVASAAAAKHARQQQLSSAAERRGHGRARLRARAGDGRPDRRPPAAVAHRPHARRPSAGSSTPRSAGPATRGPS